MSIPSAIEQAPSSVSAGTISRPAGDEESIPTLSELIASSPCRPSFLELFHRHRELPLVSRKTTTRAPRRGKRHLAVQAEEEGTPLQVGPGETFLKMWKLDNLGLSAWSPGCFLASLSETTMGSPGKIAVEDRDLPPPGHWCAVGTVCVAPLDVGTYTSWWRMCDSQGAMFGERLRLRICVR